MVNKIKIKEYSDVNEPYYTHLIPIVDYAIENGCHYTDTNAKRPFASTKSGFICHLTGKLKMQDVAQNFELPETIVVGGHNQACLFDLENNIQLCIYRE